MLRQATGEAIRERRDVDRDGVLRGWEYVGPHRGRGRIERLRRGRGCHPSCLCLHRSGVGVPARRGQRMSSRHQMRQRPSHQRRPRQVGRFRRQCRANQHHQQAQDGDRQSLLDGAGGDSGVALRRPSRRLEFGHHVHRNGRGRPATCQPQSAAGHLRHPDQTCADSGRSRRMESGHARFHSVLLQEGSQPET